MKKILVLLTLLISLQMFAKVTAGEVKEDKTVSVELEKGSPTTDDRHPRTLIPITCVYLNGVVQLSFLEDLGKMEITVTHSSIGIVAASEYDSAYGSVVVPVASESGSYLIEIVTESGEYYYGEYEL